MRKLLILPVIAGTILAGCSTDASHLGNPLLLPVSGIASVAGNAAYAQRRGKVEVFVKSNFDAVIADIAAGGGPVLTQAMTTAAIPVRDHPARALQLRADLPLYAGTPGALVTALMVYGG
jgi:hypothetical protein